MTSDHRGATSLRHRLLALISLLATAVLVVAVIVFVARNVGWLVVALVGLAVAVAGVWESSPSTCRAGRSGSWGWWSARS